jgi:hypothetical protein
MNAFAGRQGRRGILKAGVLNKRIPWQAVNCSTRCRLNDNIRTMTYLVVYDYFGQGAFKAE